MLRYGAPPAGLAHPTPPPPAGGRTIADAPPNSYLYINPICFFLFSLFVFFIKRENTFIIQYHYTISLYHIIRTFHILAGNESHNHSVLILYYHIISSYYTIILYQHFILAGNESHNHFLLIFYTHISISKFTVKNIVNLYSFILLQRVGFWFNLFLKGCLLTRLLQ